MFIARGDETETGHFNVFSGKGHEAGLGPRRNSSPNYARQRVLENWLIQIDVLDGQRRSSAATSSVGWTV